MRRKVSLSLIFCMIWQPFGVAAEPPQLSVAVAANVVYCVEALHAQFQQKNPELVIRVISGASGSLVAQIKEGAPYDIFLSADMDYPRALIHAGLAQEESLLIYAYGRLALWTTRRDLDLTQGMILLRNDAIRKIAIANPEIAPYGRAAVIAMQHEYLWDAVQPKIVIGENLSQTTQFVQTGNADIGFVAVAIVASPKLKGIGQSYILDAHIYPPLEQGAVVTTYGTRNPYARTYLQFLQSPEAHSIFREYGYELPQR